jgi:tyrosine-protein phosphatase YwqE
MVDTHLYILPSVDDESDTLDEAHDKDLASSYYK